MPQRDIMDVIRVAHQAGLFDGTSFKDGLPSGVPDVSGVAYGENGLFGVPGLEQQLISTVVQSRGLATRLPAYGTQFMWPFFGYITGFEDVPNDDPAEGPCDDPPTVGHLMNCTQTAHFGLYSYKTREYNLKRAGELLNRGEPTDLVILNNPLLRQMDNITPNVPGSLGSGNMRRDFVIRMMEMGIAFQRKLGRQIYTGNPANATNGGYDEFPGADILISTGHIDAKTQTSCPSLDSLVVDFGYGKIADTADDLYGNAQNTFFVTLTGILRYLTSLAEDTGLDPVNFLIAMRRDMFYDLSSLWPCIYMTAGCGFVDSAGQQRVVVNGNDMIRMRDDMRQARYLPLDGERYEIVLDSYIPEEANADQPADIDAGCAASDVYIIAERAGGIQTAYWQYFDYTAQFGPMDAAGDFRVSQFFWSDGGRFLWEVMPPINGCVVAESTIRPRLMLRTPQLCARIQNVQYCPARHTVDAMPGDDFYRAGGVTNRSNSEPFSQWNPS